MNKTSFESSTKIDLSEDMAQEHLLYGWEWLGFGVVVPFVCAVGIVANVLTLLVLTLRKAVLVEIFYTYLKGTITAQGFHTTLP